MATENRDNSSKLVQFGIFEADLRSGELRRSGVRIRLQEQPFKLLDALLEAPGEVVSRETLQRQLWDADTTVDYNHSLGTAVNKLREALGDKAENPRFVETLAKRGYRFIAPVRKQWTTLTTHGVGDPTWSHDGRSLYFQDFLEEGKPIYRIPVPAGQAKLVATIGSLSPVTATDYRLIGLAPGDLPVVSAHTSTVNLYSVDLNEH